MSETPVQIETPRQKLAQAARQDDMKAANDGARTAAQTSIIINGGSATAIVALISNYVAKTSSTGVPFYLLFAGSLSLFGYAIGVSLGAWSMWCASQASAQFGMRWETFLDTEIGDSEQEETAAQKNRPPRSGKQKIEDWKKDKQDTEMKYLAEANVWLGKHRRSFGFSILSFILASGVMAIGLGLSVDVAPLKKSDVAPKEQPVPGPGRCCTRADDL